MSVSATVTPGVVLSENEEITISKLNALGTPTVDVSGAVGTLSLAAGSVTNTEIATSAAIQHDKLAALSTGQLIVGNAGTPTATTVSGDATIAADGAVTIANDAVTTDKVLDGAITAAKLDSAAVSSTPTGSISGFIKSAAAPSGWVYCDGSHYDSTASDYTALFALIQYQYGRTDSSGGDDETGTYFKVPNLKGRIPIGYDSSQTEFDLMGETGGAKSHTLTISEMPSHTHTVTLGGSDGSGTGNKASRTPNSNTTQTTSATGGGTAFDIMNPYVVVEYIIKL